MKSPDQASGLPPTGMPDPGHPTTPPAREPARLTALHRGICRPPGPRVRGGGCGRRGPQGTSSPPGPRHRRGPRDGSGQAAGRRGRPPLPLPPTEGQAPRRFRTPAQRCSSRNGHPRRKSASGARRGGVPGDAPARGLVTRRAGEPPLRPTARTTGRCLDEGRRSGEDAAGSADGEMFRAEFFGGAGKALTIRGLAAKGGRQEAGAVPGVGRLGRADQPPLPGGERSAAGRERWMGDFREGSPSPAALRASTSPRRGEVKMSPARRLSARCGGSCAG